MISYSEDNGSEMDFSFSRAQSSFTPRSHPFSPPQTKITLSKRFFQLSLEEMKIYTLFPRHILPQSLSVEAVSTSLLCHLSSVTGCFIAPRATLVSHRNSSVPHI